MGSSQPLTPAMKSSIGVLTADEQAFLKAWQDDAVFMKEQPGFISTQLHRSIGESPTYLNYAVWESTAHFRAAFTNPGFRAKLASYPSSAVATPHLFQRLAAPGVCVAWVLSQMSPARSERTSCIDGRKTSHDKESRRSTRMIDLNASIKCESNTSALVPIRKVQLPSCPLRSNWSGIAFILRWC